jgi:cell division protein FtsB
MELLRGTESKRITINDIGSVLDDNKMLENVLNCLNIKNTDDFINSDIYKKSKNSKLKRKIYQRIYYLVSNDKIFRKISHRNFFRHKWSTNSNILFNLPLIIIISSYLIYESQKFFIHFGFERFWAITLPLTIEMVILRLSLESGLKSKFLAYMLIFFNSISFSYYSYQVYCSKVEKINKAKIYNANLDKRRSKLDLEIKDLKAELEKMNSVYRVSLSKGYISSSAKGIFPRIKSLERQLSEKKAGLNATRVQPHESLSVVLIMMFLIIILKMLLQICSFYFVKLI